MALAAGTPIGPYEIVAPLGKGGMGVVYRARDPRIGREVAIKMIAPHGRDDPERLRRFREEVRAAGSLNHPNVVVVHDVGVHAGDWYLVTELLQGETLRDRLDAGPLGRGEVLRIGAAAARGVAVAHARGIVHRDLKPGNLFLTEDGEVKVLDFGLARLPADQSAGDGGGTATASGAYLGTVPYMSPEQIGGKPADARADVFALGVVLYEMIAGRRPFAADSDVELGYAILKEEPPPLDDSGIDAVVRRCLEKTQARRFASAGEVAAALEALAGAAQVPPSPGPRRSVIFAAVAAVAVVGGLLILWRLSSGPEATPAAGPGASGPTAYRRLTARSGVVDRARFTPDGQVVVFGADWGGPGAIYSLAIGEPEARAIAGAGVELFAVSGSGDLAVRLDDNGTLARTHLGGSTPRPLVADVAAADWLPDGNLVVARRVRAASGETLSVIEWPVGREVYRTERQLRDVRAGPGGGRIAFVEGDVMNTSGEVVVLERSGKRRVLGRDPAFLGGLAWSRDGTEVWTGTSGDGGYAVRAFSLRGTDRVVAAGTDPLRVQDIDDQGRALVVRELAWESLRVKPPGEEDERELSWLDTTWLRDLDATGRRLVFHEWTPATGGAPVGYVRGVDGTPAVRLGSGVPSGISPDGQWVLMKRKRNEGPIWLVPTGTGQERALPAGSLNTFEVLRWFPDGKRILIFGESKGESALWVQAIDRGEPRLLARGSLRTRDTDPISPDGRFIVAHQPVGRGRILISVESSEAKPLGGIDYGDGVVGWSSDGAWLFVQRGDGRPMVVVERLEIATGRVEPWRRLGPAAQNGELSVGEVHVAAGGDAYAYSYLYRRSDLYLLEPSPPPAGASPRR